MCTPYSRIGWSSWALLSLFALLLQPVSSKDNSPKCDCYLVSGPDPGYFQHHRFWDFRNIPTRHSNNDDYTLAPPLVTNDENQGTESVTSSYLQSSSWQADWGIQQQSGRPDDTVPAVNSAQNVYISRNTTVGSGNTTYLTLRTNRLDSFQSIAEVQSNYHSILYSSIRGRFRVLPNGLANPPSSGDQPVTDDSSVVDAGAVVGFFTYQSDTQESDIEILTKDAPSQIHYSNQPDYDYQTDSEIPGTTAQVTLPNTTSYIEWADHRIDWFDTISRWYVNGQTIDNNTVNVPQTPSTFIINLWGNGESWSGNMTVGGQVVVGVEWIEMIFNSSDRSNSYSKMKDKRDESFCKIGCAVDDVPQTGLPVVIFNNLAGAVLPMGGDRSMIWGPHGIWISIGLMFVVL